MTTSNHFRGQVTLFYNKWKDGITTISDNTLPSPFELRYVNNNKLESKCIEAELHYDFDYWLLDIAAAYTDSENSLDNSDFVAFPEYMLNFNMGYNLPEHKMQFYLSNRGLFNMQANPDESSKNLDTYWVTSLNIKYLVSKDSTILLDVRNLFDRDNVMPSVWGNPNGIPEDGIQASISYKRSW
jgi:outer membrane receptor for ferrienterochelin and colicin